MKANNQCGPYDGLLVSQLIAQRDKMKVNPPTASSASQYGVGCSSEGQGHLTSQQSITEHSNPQSIAEACGSKGLIGSGQPSMPDVGDIEKSLQANPHDSTSSGSVNTGLIEKTTKIESESLAVKPSTSQMPEQSLDNHPCPPPAFSETVTSPTFSDKAMKTEVVDPTDDLGPISSGKQIKLDFSRVSPQSNTSDRHTQPLQSPNHPLVSPGAGMMSPSRQMVNRSPSHSLSSPSHVMGSRPQSRPPSQPLASPSGVACQSNVQQMNMAGHRQYNPLMVQTSPDSYHMQQTHGQMRASPRFTFPPNPMMQHGTSGMLVQMHSGNMQQMNPAMHHGMAMMGSPPIAAQQQGMMGNTESMMGNSSQHGGGMMMQGMPHGTTPMYQYNMAPPGYAGTIQFKSSSPHKNQVCEIPSNLCRYFLLKCAEINPCANVPENFLDTLMVKNYTYSQFYRNTVGIHKWT